MDGRSRAEGQEADRNREREEQEENFLPNVPRPATVEQAGTGTGIGQLECDLGVPFCSHQRFRDESAGIRTHAHPDTHGTRRQSCICVCGVRVVYVPSSMIQHPASMLKVHGGRPPGVEFDRDGPLTILPRPPCALFLASAICPCRYTNKTTTTTHTHSFGAGRATGLGGKIFPQCRHTSP